jgi:hypothetical protein
MSEQEDVINERHDPMYAAWLAANLDDFVLLVRTYDIYRATCPRVRPLRWPERRPSLLGGGVPCSRGIAPLEYALMMIEGAVHLCAPASPNLTLSGSECTPNTP